MINHLIIDKPMRPMQWRALSRKLRTCRCADSSKEIFSCLICVHRYKNNNGINSSATPSSKKKLKPTRECLRMLLKEFTTGSSVVRDPARKEFIELHIFSLLLLSSRTEPFVQLVRRKKNLRNRYLSSLFSEGDEDGDNFLCPCGFCLTNPRATFRLVHFYIPAVKPRWPPLIPYFLSLYSRIVIEWKSTLGESTITFPPYGDLYTQKNHLQWSPSFRWIHFWLWSKTSSFIWRIYWHIFQIQLTVDFHVGKWII